ncbi:DUF4265 domain-containing protein [Flavobacterium sp. 245]|uniref:DUF4265 domain-containing protein n=1 Tax=Flavobacterium sp. 245 TaxID=2512115 RepID=UPI001060A143|nr:DUF4265 domain-containing protein [Flavobacterium sp. 245]TDP02967.1 uncharacterized protein DUF4265 [Flavobacterium sp. 245]
MQERHTKILFKYYSSFLEETVSETMWAEIINLEKGFFRLDNIPFFGASIATGDLFYAEYEEEEKKLVYKETIEHSGNSIVQILILEGGFDKEIISEKLQAINCISESLNDTFLAVEIVRDVDYAIVKNVLIGYEDQSVIEFAEPYISEKHRADLLKN